MRPQLIDRDQSGLIVLGYARVSTLEQRQYGHGIEAQEFRIREACNYKNLTLLDIASENGSGKDLSRPALQSQLERIATGEADGLVVAKLDRLTRSLVDFTRLLEWFDEAQAALVVLDLDLDTSTATGELIAHFMAALAQWERRTISQRNKDVIASMRAQGVKHGRGGVQDNPQLAAHIHELRATGMSYDKIAAQLNAENVPTIRGAAAWRGSTLGSFLGPPRRQKAHRRAELPRITRKG